MWLAQDLEVGEWVAIKVFSEGLSETDRERLRREVRLGRSLQHPGLVRLFELIETGDRLALVMEWLPGGNLSRRVETGPLPVDEVVRVADEALDALEYLHANGVVHRDVKPSNLLADDGGKVKLADLGLARPLADGRDLTVTNMTVGTPGYMSPEQLRGETARPPSDLYSLGATLYRLLTGDSVFESASQYEVARLHLSGRPRDPRELRPDCPKWLARFVLRLLEKRAEDRWPDAAAARDALHRRAGMTSPRVRRTLAAAGAAVVVAVLGLVFAGRMAFETLWHPSAEKVEASGAELRGLNSRGAVVWRVAFENPVRQVEQLDVDGDGTLETSVVAPSGSFKRGGGAHDHSEVAIVDRRGGVVSRFVPEEGVSFWPFEYPKRFYPAVSVLGIGRDGSPALVLNCRHRVFYPTVLEAYRPRTGRWEPFLYHAGWIESFIAVPGSRPPRLRFQGVNNLLCMYPVVGEIVVDDPDRPATRPEAATRVTNSAAFPPDSPFRLSWYTPIDVQGQYVGTLALAEGGSTVISLATVSRVVDSLGNPVPGPNSGVDLRANRMAFLVDLEKLARNSQPVTAAGVEQLLDSLRARHAVLLRERPYRTILETLGARALARAGGLREAIAMLQRLRQESDAPEVTLRLAHLTGIAGDLEGAKRLAQEVLNGANSTRRYDAAQLLRHLSFETRDVEGVRAAATTLGFVEQTEEEAAGVTATLWGGAHMWWDELTDTDTRAVASAFAPAAEAVACVARWRLGRTAPEDPDLMTASEEANPEARGPCRAARAAALIGLGRPREAATLLDEISSQLENGGTDDFELIQGVGLARAIYAKALLAAGDRDHARRFAESLRSQLRPGLLPRILVDEVIRDTAARIDGR